MKSLLVLRLIALFERVIADLRDAIVALERGEIDDALEKARGAGERISEHASDLATSQDAKEGTQ